MKKILGLFKKEEKSKEKTEKTEEELNEIYGTAPDGCADYYGDYSENKKNYYN